MTNLTPGNTIQGFTLTAIKPVPEVDATAYIMRHEATGAELLYLNTGDEEMGFAIGFRTCPADNTGVFHILEHSVLCGSDKYPVKEPFVHLLKSSMQTFLNAMTGADSTIFPVASTNEKDLMNLMSVYLDAVFHPAILREPRIFKQEGWHYETDGKDLAVNGVVYNEMKGALAEPSRVLASALSEELFPDTAYRFESGGAPGEIETLSYEQFIDTYRRHYKPDNAAIVLCGSLDLDVFLSAIDEQLISACTETSTTPIGNPNPRGTQKPTISSNRKIFLKALPQDAEIRFGTVFADAMDRRKSLAMAILSYALLGTNESPLKRMLLDTGIASDYSFGMRCATRRYLTISARNPKPNSAEAFLNALREGCQKVLSEGIRKDLLEASLFGTEFALRTNNGNGKPSAIELMMPCLSIWSSEGPLDSAALRYNDDFEFLRTAIETDYFDCLLREAILESSHYAIVELCPIVEEEQTHADVGNEQRAKPEPDASNLERIEHEQADLKAFQEAPDSPESLASLPRLNRADCLNAPYYAGYQSIEDDDFAVLRHEYAEDGIAHIIRYYDMSSLSQEDFRYIDTLIWVISQTDTLRHSAQEILQLKDGRLGTIFADAAIDTDDWDGSLGAYVWVYTCSLASDIDFTSDYVDEILHETVFANRSKLREGIERLYQRNKAIAIDAMPQLTASTRAKAHIAGAAVLDDMRSGLEGYRFIKELRERCKDDDEADKVLRRLEIICARVFGNRPALISFSGDDGTYKRFIEVERAIAPKYEKRAAKILASLSEEEMAYASSPALSDTEPLASGDEAFVIPSDVAYCAEALDVSDMPSLKSGKWIIADQAAELDYLWNSVRVTGGAYGADFSVSRKGTATFKSWQDPRIDGTFRCFHELGSWLKEFDPDDEELDGYVISATASFDRPTKGLPRIYSQSRSHLFGRTLKDRERQRQEIVSCTAEEVRKLGEELAGCTGKRCSVVLAGRELIEQSEHEFVVEEVD